MFLMTVKDFAKTKDQLYLKPLRPGWKQSLAHLALVFSTHYFSSNHGLFLLFMQLAFSSPSEVKYKLLFKL